MNKKHIQWILITAIIVIVGIFILQIVGKLFIKEIVQDVIVEEPKQISSVVIGEQAPHFDLANFVGQKTALSDFFGQPIVLTFWTSWNSMAVDQINIFDKFLSNNNQSFTIITVNNQETRNVVSQFMRRGAYQVTVFLDESGAVGELYEIRNVPTTYFIDRDGVVQDIFVGILSEKLLLDKVQTIIR